MSDNTNMFAIANFDLDKIVNKITVISKSHSKGTSHSFKLQYLYKGDKPWNLKFSLPEGVVLNRYTDEAKTGGDGSNFHSYQGRLNFDYSKPGHKEFVTRLLEMHIHVCTNLFAEKKKVMDVIKTNGFTKRATLEDKLEALYEMSIPEPVYRKRNEDGSGWDEAYGAGMFVNFCDFSGKITNGKAGNKTQLRFPVGKDEKGGIKFESQPWGVMQGKSGEGVGGQITVDKVNIHGKKPLNYVWQLDFAQIIGLETDAEVGSNYGDEANVTVSEDKMSALEKALAEANAQLAQYKMREKADETAPEFDVDVPVTNRAELANEVEKEEKTEQPEPEMVKETKEPKTKKKRTLPADE
jgi:hypothetical protein